MFQPYGHAAGGGRGGLDCQLSFIFWVKVQGMQGDRMPFWKSKAGGLFVSYAIVQVVSSTQVFFA